MDAAAVEKVYRTHSYAIFRRCLQLLRCEALAKDVMQEVFLRLLETPDSFAGRARVSTYLYAAASNRCLNRLRNDRRRGDAWQQAVLAERQHGSTEDPAEHVERRLAVDAVLREQDEVTALIALHHYVDGLSQGEIADVVSLSRVTVNQRLARFRARAQQRLKEAASRPYVMAWLAPILACTLFFAAQNHGDLRGALRSKGGDVFALYVHRGEGAVLLGDTCQPGDQIRARYASELPYLMVLGGAVGESPDVLFPASGQRSAWIGTSNSAQLTPGSWVLDDRLGDDQFIAVFSSADLDARDVLLALRTSPASALDGRLTAEKKMSVRSIVMSCHKQTP